MLNPYVCTICSESIIDVVNELIFDVDVDSDVDFELMTLRLSPLVLTKLATSPIFLLTGMFSQTLLTSSPLNYITQKATPRQCMLIIYNI